MNKVNKKKNEVVRMKKFWIFKSSMTLATSPSKVGRRTEHLLLLQYKGAMNVFVDIPSDSGLILLHSYDYECIDMITDSCSTTARPDHTFCEIVKESSLLFAKNINLAVRGHTT